MSAHRIVGVENRRVVSVVSMVRNLRTSPLNACNGNNNNWQWMACCMRCILFGIYPARWHVLSVFTRRILTHPLTFHLWHMWIRLCVSGWNAASAHYLHEDNREWQLCQLGIRALDSSRMRAFILHINKIFSFFTKSFYGIPYDTQSETMEDDNWVRVKKTNLKWSESKCWQRKKVERLQSRNQTAYFALVWIRNSRTLEIPPHLSNAR